jgi:hypothetical protein
MKNTAKYFVIQSGNEITEHSNLEEVGRVLAEHEGDANEVMVIRGEHIPFAINREPTVTFGTPAKATRKARKKTGTTEAAIRAADDFARRTELPAPSDAKPKRKYTKRATSNGTPALHDGTPVELP